MQIRQVFYSWLRGVIGFSGLKMIGKCVRSFAEQTINNVVFCDQN